MLVQLASSGVEIEVISSTALVAGDIALASETWRFHYPEPDDSVYRRDLPATAVLKHCEQRWKLAVLTPWSGGGI